MTHRHRATLIICTALLLRLLRALCRWDEWALHYAGYYQGAVRSLGSGDPGAALTQWNGLHPPLYGLLHAAMNLIYPAPLLWLLFSALCSLVAVVALLASRSTQGVWLAALILATDPVQLHYAAEVNNYPLLAGICGIAWWARSHDRWLWLGLAGAIGAATHVLGGVVIGLMALTHAQRWRALLVMGAGVAPLVPGALDLLTDVGHQRQPPLLLQASLLDAIERFSPSFLLLLPLLAWGFVRRPAVGAIWGGCVVFWVLLVMLKLAAPHQFPYAVVLGLPAAVLIATAARSTLLMRAVVALCVLRGLWVGGGDIKRLSEVWADEEATAVAEELAQHSRPGDAIVLVRGLSEQDDDKRHTSSMLWRCPPWEPMPSMDVSSKAPHLHGSPRIWRQRILYTFDQPRDVIGHLEHRRVFTVAYDAALNDSAIPRHPSQGDWQERGHYAIRRPIADPASSEPD